MRWDDRGKFQGLAGKMQRKSFFCIGGSNSPSSLKSEKEKIRLARIDPRVFGEIYDEHYPRIFGYLYRITGDRALAGDITSETFLKAFLHIGAFRWKGISISAWFFRIATNELNQYYRKKSYRAERLLEVTGYDGVDWGNRHALSHESNAVSQQMDRFEEFAHIRRLLEGLPAKYRQVIALRFFEELSLREIAEILNKKEGTVRSLLSRGLDRLKKMLEAPATKEGG